MECASTRPRPDRRGPALFIAAALAISVMDQVTKAVVRRGLPPGASWPDAATPVGRLFSFTHVANTGVSFGMFKGHSTLFLVLTLLVAAGLVVYRRTLARDALAANAALGMIVAGALGNAVDRARFGQVTDFLDFKFWPVFNVADSSVFLGVLLLLWCTWREDRMRERPAAVEHVDPVDGSDGDGSNGLAACADESGGA
jgi:signal peptidase II